MAGQHGPAAPASPPAPRRAATCRCPARRARSAARGARSRRRARTSRAGGRAPSRGPPAAGRSGGRSAGRPRRARRAGSRRPRAGRRGPACRTTCHVDSASRISPRRGRRAPAARRRRAPRRSRGGLPAATTSPVQAPARTPNGSPSRSSAAAPQRALRVVLVRQRHAQHRHDRVAVQLDDAAAVAREDRRRWRGSVDDGAAAPRGRSPARPGRPAARRRMSPSGARRAGARRRACGGCAGSGPPGAGSPPPARAARATARCRARPRAPGARRGRRRARPPGARRGRARASAGRAAARAAGLADQRLELPGDLGVPAAARGRPRCARCTQSRRRSSSRAISGCAKRSVGDVGERRPAPQLERLAQRRRGLPGLAAGELLAPAPQRCLEAVGVERRRGRRARRSRRRLTAPARRRARPAAATRRHTPRCARSGARAFPQLVEHAVRCTASPRCTSSSASSECARPRGTWARPAGFEVDLDRPEDPELRVHPRVPIGSRRGESVPKAGSRACPHAHCPAHALRRPAARLTPWGMLAALDVHDADAPGSRSRRHPRLRRRARRHDRHARPRAADLERFGEGELEGWSAMQFIETSSITVHADEVFGRLLRRRLLLPAVRSVRSPRTWPSPTSAARRPCGCCGDDIELVAVLGVLSASSRSPTPCRTCATSCGEPRGRTAGRG